MSILSWRILRSVAAAVVVVSISGAAYAAPTGKVAAAPTPAAPKQAPAAKDKPAASGTQDGQDATGTDAKKGQHKDEIDALKAAYKTLEIADHDYDGHRVHAMEAIEKACDILGSDIRGHGKGGEKQPISDAQLKDAQGMVQKVRSGIANGKQKKLAGHLDEAIKHISIALTIK